MHDVVQTSIHTDHDRRYGCSELRVYVNDTELHNIADQWFQQNNVYEMKVVSKAWNKIVRYLNRVFEVKLAQHYKVPQEHVKYSRTCGCSCGCSPGFRLKHVAGELRYKNARVNIQVEPYEVQGVRDLIASQKFQRVWNQDILNHEVAQA